MPAWLIAIVTHWSVKGIAIVVGIGLIIGSYYFTYKTAYNTAYSVGYSKSLKDNPPNVYNGPSTINQQPCPPPTVYGIDIGKWAIGLVHKK
jgi:hypothetical protein